MYSWEWQQIKIGLKLRKDDNSIWEVIEQLDDEHYKVACITEKPKKGQYVATIAKNSFGWSTVLNSFEYECTITKTIYANSEEEAYKMLMNEEFEVHYSDFKLKNKNIIS